MKAIGIHLQSQIPTPEELERLKDRAKRELGEKFRIRTVVAFDFLKKERVFRLDAIQE